MSPQQGQQTMSGELGAPSGQAGGNGVDFQAAADSLSAIKTSNDQLQQQIASGHLYMAPDAANKAAQAYDSTADQVEQLARTTDRLIHVDGLGAYPSGRQLAQKFELKAHNSATGMGDLLAQLGQELRKKARLFRQAGKDYQEREAQRAHALGKVIQ